MNNEFVINPNLPTKKVSKVIIDGKISKEAEDKLNTLEIECIKTVKCIDTYEEISTHPDIQMIHIGDNKIVVSNNILKEYNQVFDKLGIEYIKGNKNIEYKYPKDIAYNACIIDKYFIHTLKYIDEILLKEMYKRNMKMININQGYSKCNISIVNNDSIITSDRNIEKELSKYLDVLYIENENKILLGKMNGFIGGATGLIDKDKWVINGDINSLINCNKIIDFLNEKNMKIICLTNSEVIDIGSIIPIIY